MGQVTDSAIPRCVALTGGTGSFGQAFARYLLANTNVRIRIISRDEAKQDDMKRELKNDSRLTFILGDVRDYGKMRTAFDGADAVVHAAALKRVPTGETQADELIKTNIVGTLNVLDAAISARVPRSLFISTDKAVMPINEYGKSKAVAEGQFIQANIRGTSRHVRFAVARGGNVWGSRGSVLDVWRGALAHGEPIIVHDPQATRFCLPMALWTTFCWRALQRMRGGEIFVPLLRAWRLDMLAEAVLREYASPLDNRVNGARDGDKRHETLIAPHEIPRTIEVDAWTYIVEPPDEIRQVWNYTPWTGREVDPHMQYTSESVPHMSVDELREAIRCL